MVSKIEAMSPPGKSVFCDIRKRFAGTRGPSCAAIGVARARDAARTARKARIEKPPGHLRASSHGGTVWRKSGKGLDRLFEVKRAFIGWPLELRITRGRRRIGRKSWNGPCGETGQGKAWALGCRAPSGTQAGSFLLPTRSLALHARALSEQIVVQRSATREARSEAEALKGQNARFLSDLERAHTQAVMAERRLWTASTPSAMALLFSIRSSALRQRTAATLQGSTAFRSRLACLTPISSASPQLRGM